MFEAGDGVVRGIEVAFIDPEAHGGAVAAFANGFHHGERFDDVAMRAGKAVKVAVARDFDFEAGGEGIDDGDADAVQAAGEVVVFAAEFAARVQAGEDEFNAADAFFGVDIDRHAATVVADGKRAVGVQGNADGGGVSGKRFIDAVVDDFLREVVGAGGVGVHPWPFADGVQAFQDVYIGGAIAHAGFLGRVWAGRYFIVVHRKFQTRRVAEDSTRLYGEATQHRMRL